MKDPYKYFRLEARELLDGLAAGVLELEKGQTPAETLTRLLRLAHTLKGAARVVRQPGIAELAHEAEGVLTSRRTSGGALDHGQASELLALFDRMAALLSALDPVTPVEVKSTAAAASDERIETVRIDIRELDVLLRDVAEAAVHVGAVRRSLRATEQLGALSRALVEQLAARPGDMVNGVSSALGRARSAAEELRSELDQWVRVLASDLERVEGGLGEIQELTQRLRLIPAKAVFPALERAVRDAAQTLGKQVDFESVGGDVRLDAQVLASLRDALMHVVRNAVAHGIETEPERLARGKPARGKVRLVAERRGARVSFACQDDGAGVDIEAVRRAAVLRNLVSASQARALDEAGVLELLGVSGLTTASAATELSGRGIGLDVARATSAKLKGEMSIRSYPERGTLIELQVPVSIASLQGLVVECSEGAAVIPLDAVRRTLRVQQNDVSRASDKESILYEGKVIPFMPLEHALRAGDAGRRRQGAWSAVVVQAGNRHVAIGVDRLRGTSNIVMRTLPRVVAADAVVGGVSLDADGNPQLLLDPGGLVAAAERRLGAAQELSEPTLAPILIVDDSLTTRMLEQSILESAGYVVDIAASAEEGLAKAKERPYSLFVVDVEMPGMDGFGFVSETRAHPVLREIPAILVTSRNAVEDRQRGAQVGARAYIVKGEFDQGLLLTTIRRLIG